MSLVPFTFKNVELKVVTINSKPWARAKEVCRALKYDAKTSKTANIIRAHCSQEIYAQKYQMTSLHAACTPMNWPKDSQKYNIYINEEGCMSFCFLDNSHWQKSSENTAVMSCFHTFASS